MIGANSGLGFQVMNAQYNFQIPLMFGAILLLAALGLVANAILENPSEATVPMGSHEVLSRTSSTDILIKERPL